LFAVKVTRALILNPFQISPDVFALVILRIVINQIGGRSMNDKSAKPTIEMVTLKQLCTELKVDPREARERLRFAARDAKKNPELAKSHKPGHGWEWPKNSAALKEARIVLAS
jgi:hypothetical protein